MIKDFVGAPAVSTVTLNIRHGDVVDETDASVPDGGHIGPKVLLPGAYVVNETSAGNNVDLDLYTSSIVCTKPGDGDPITVGSADGRLINVDLADGEAITCTITNTRKARSISVEKTVSATSDGDFVSAPDIATKPENGGTFYFKVKITNESSADTITVTSLADIMGGSGIEVDNLVCDGADQENLDGLPFELGPGLSKTCTFTHDLVGNAGDTETDHVDVSWKDGEGSTEEPESSNDAIIALTDVPSTITVTKTANPTVVQDSGLVTFTVVVRNDSAVDTVYIQTLTDSIYGDVNGKGTCTLEDGIAAGPAGSRQILPSASYTCTFTATVSQTETDVVTATGVDDDDQPVSDDDNATVTFTPTPPPPYVPHSDVTVTKAATPAVQLPQGGGTAPITYNIACQEQRPRRGTERACVGCRSGGCDVRLGDDREGHLHDDGPGSRLHDLEPGRRRVGADHDQRHGQRDRDEDERRRDQQHDAAGHEPEQQHRLGFDGRHCSCDAADPEAAARDLRAAHRDPEGAEGEREGSEDQREGDEGEEAGRRSEGQDHGPGHQQDGHDREERQGDRDREARQAGDHPPRDPGREDVQHAADRCRRRLRAAGHRVDPGTSRKHPGGGGQAAPSPFVQTLQGLGNAAFRVINSLG